MKEENNSSAGMWAGAVAGLLLLYLLSLGPVALYYQNTHQTPPKWGATVYFPMGKLSDRSKTFSRVYEIYLRAIGVKT